MPLKPKQTNKQTNHERRVLAKVIPWPLGLYSSKCEPPSATSVYTRLLECCSRAS